MRSASLSLLNNLGAGSLKRPILATSRTRGVRFVLTIGLAATSTKSKNTIIYAGNVSKGLRSVATIC